MVNLRCVIVGCVVKFRCGGEAEVTGARHQRGSVSLSFASGGGSELWWHEDSGQFTGDDHPFDIVGIKRPPRTAEELRHALSEIVSIVDRCKPVGNGDWSTALSTIRNIAEAFS